MNSKNIWMMVIAVLVFTTSACGQRRGGQRGGGQEERHKIPTEKQIQTMVSDLTTDILLSEEQEKIVLELYKDHFESVEELTSYGRPDRKKMEALKETLEADITDLLTEDQKELYEKHLKEEEENRPERRSRQ